MVMNNKNERRVIELPIIAIRPCKNQARVYFKREEMQQLAISIRENGILQPLTVRRVSKTEYELIAGERRLRAASMCGMKNVPCIVMNCNDGQATVFGLLENLQREDLNIFEEAEGIKKLIVTCGFTQLEAARRLGKRQSTIANKLRLLKLTKEERDYIIRSELSERHARTLIKIDDESVRKLALSEVITSGLNVKQTEQLVDKLLSDIPVKKSKQTTKIIYKDIRIFVNTISKAVDTMRHSGIEAVSEKNETEEYIEYRVKIPKKTAIKKDQVIKHDDEVHDREINRQELILLAQES